MYFVFLLTVQAFKHRNRLPTRQILKSKTNRLLQNIKKNLSKKHESKNLNSNTKGIINNNKGKLPIKPVSHISNSNINGLLQNAKKMPSFSPTKNKCRLAPALCKTKQNKKRFDIFSF